MRIKKDQHIHMCHLFPALGNTLKSCFMKHSLVTKLLLLKIELYKLGRTSQQTNIFRYLDIPVYT